MVYFRSLLFLLLAAILLVFLLICEGATVVVEQSSLAALVDQQDIKYAGYLLRNGEPDGTIIIPLTPAGTAFVARLRLLNAVSFLGTYDAAGYPRYLLHLDELPDTSRRDLLIVLAVLLLALALLFAVLL